AFASQLQTELDDARDETIYLKVKLRKNEPLGRGEYAELRDRIENIRSRARGDSSGRFSAPPPSARTANPDQPSSTSRPSSSEIPVGTEFDVRLQNTLSSATA